MKENDTSAKSKEQNISLIHDKSKFVSSILDYSVNKKVDDKTKERLINLISKEIDKSGIVESDILERLEKVEGMINGSAKISKQLNVENKYIANLHKPKETYYFLNFFNQNEGGLKNLTHRFNNEYIDYDLFINKCLNEFEQGKKEFPNVKSSLLKRIEEFAFSKSPKWYIRKGKEEYKPKLGWSEPEFVKWYKENKKHPGDDARYNKEMIIPFKESIQVRSDTGNFVRLINETIEIVFGENRANFKFNINYEHLKTAQFYTNVDDLGQAIFHILGIIKDIANQNFCFEITVDYYNDDSFKIISITHVNSEATKKSNDKDFMGGGLKSIKSNLYGLCNYEIYAKFPDGYRKKIILTDNYIDYKKYVETNESFPVDNSIDIKGFTHILKFY